MAISIPRGASDHRARVVCQDCGHVVYSNPKVVVACVLLDTSITTSSSSSSSPRCLLGQRAIAPRAGYWGFPQGFLEHGETTREAAVREVQEEFQLHHSLIPADLQLRAIYNIPGSVQLVYEARVDAATVQYAKSTAECSAIAFFERDQLPELCFPTVQWALDHCWSLPAASSDGNNTNRIQQKTKAYGGAVLDKWIEVEDEPLGEWTSVAL